MVNIRSRHIVSLAAIGALALAGCKSHPLPPESHNAQMQLASAPPPITPRPNVPAPPFKVFHRGESSITLVTKESASDDEIAALVWQLRDAQHAHSFDKLGIPQKMIDKRNPIIWFHIYRGSRCASEKYAPGKLPCGPAYHAAGDYTLGGFTNKDHEEGVVLKDENHQTPVWKPDEPYNAPNT